MESHKFEPSVTISMKEYNNLKKIQEAILNKKGSVLVGWYGNEYWLVSLSDDKALLELKDMNNGLQNQISVLRGSQNKLEYKPKINNSFLSRIFKFCR